MGRGFASALSSRHEVVFGSRDPGRARKVVRSTGAVAAIPYSEAAAGSEVVILAARWHAMGEVLSELGDLSGTVVVDVSVPHGKEREALGRRSSGEVVQKRLPRARVSRGGTTSTPSTSPLRRWTGSPPQCCWLETTARPSGSSLRWPGTWDSIRWTWVRFERAITWTGGTAIWTESR